jgi:hypothetical protein
MVIQDDRSQARQEYFGCRGTKVDQGIAENTGTARDTERPSRQGGYPRFSQANSSSFKSRGDTSEIRERTHVAGPGRGRHAEPV